MTRESKEIQRPISRVSPAKRLGAKKIQTDRGPAAETEPNRLYPKRIAAWKPPRWATPDQWGMKGMKPVIAPTIFLKVRTPEWGRAAGPPLVAVPGPPPAPRSGLALPLLPSRVSRMPHAEVARSARREPWRRSPQPWRPRRERQTYLRAWWANRV